MKLWQATLIVGCLVPVAALAQDAPAVSADQINQAYDWICSNRSTVEPILETVVGLSVVSHGIGIVMKKLGVTGTATWIGKAFTVIRALNGDVKPPPGAIVKQAAAVVAANPEIAASTGASPTRMSAAADAITAKP